jgi:hypothetical protein
LWLEYGVIPRILITEVKSNGKTNLGLKSFIQRGPDYRGQIEWDDQFGTEVCHR